MQQGLREKIERLRGPVLVLGASGFVGANLFRMVQECRNDVFGTASRVPAWRLEGMPQESVLPGDLLFPANVKAVLDRCMPATVFDLVAYGAYSFEQDAALIYRTNVVLAAELLDTLGARGVKAYVHAGSSSEYGARGAAPSEDSPLAPNSHYAVSKAALSGLLAHLGRDRGLPCANLRLYSVYGPWEDPSRLMPELVANAAEGRLPPFVDPRISRDFVYVSDACEAFVDAALFLEHGARGESFNVGSGRATRIGELALLARELFQVEEEPVFSMPARAWDTETWHADPSKAARMLGWQARVPLEAGLERMAAWYRGLAEPARYRSLSKKDALDTRYSLSAVVACYRDEQAIPVMHRRLTEVLTRLRIDYEIIFVNDCSPDDSERVIREITGRDRRVLGISHSRNFGSQAAFRSGMELSTKNACVLLDGDLQDPPELIESFVAEWRAGHDVVYGRRVRREMPWYQDAAYKLFYRIFNCFSYIDIPLDAGDFSLIDRRVVRSILQFPERDFFLRGVRAFAGFRQTGVDYRRPERPFGRSTNSLLKNIGWAKKGIFSFSNTPLNILSGFSAALFVLVCLIGTAQIVTKLAFPEIAPRGLTTVILIQLFFGSAVLLAVSLLGEYLGKVLEEVKRRPHFLRRSLIKDGEIRDAAEQRLVE